MIRAFAGNDVSVPAGGSANSHQLTRLWVGKKVDWRAVVVGPNRSIGWMPLPSLEAPSEGIREPREPDNDKEERDSGTH